MEYSKDHPENYSAFQLAGAANICSTLRYLVNTIGGIDPSSGEPDMKPRGEFSDRLTALYNIHMTAAKLGLLNAGIDADQYGMYRAKNGIGAMTKDEVFLGGVAGRFTHSLSEWAELDKQGRLKPEDREVILLQYATSLSSNLHAIGNAFYCAFRTAEAEIKKNNHKPTLLRLFSRRQFQPCEMLPGFDEKNMNHLDWKRMFALSFAGHIPELNIPQVVLKGIDFDKQDMQSVKIAAEEKKEMKATKDEAFSREHCIEWFKGLPFDDLVLAFKFYGPDGDTPDTKAPGYILDPHDRTVVNKALSDYLNIPTNQPEVDESVIRESSGKMFLNAISSLSDATLKQMRQELSDSGLGVALSTKETAKKNKYRPVPFLETYLNTDAVELGTASKFHRIQVRAGVPGETISTVASDGTKETKNTVHEGDFVVHNVGNPDNQWIIDTKTMMKKYEPVPGEEGIYKPKGGPMKVYSLNEPIEFTAPWGEKMRVEADGFILQDPDNPKDAYGISAKDFAATYRISAKQTDESISHQEKNNLLNDFKSLPNFQIVNCVYCFGHDKNNPKHVPMGTLPEKKDQDLIDDILTEIRSTPIGSEEQDLAMRKKIDTVFSHLSTESLELIHHDMGIDEFKKEFDGLKQKFGSEDATLDYLSHKDDESEIESVKERLREDIDYECSRVLRTLDEHGKMKAPIFSPAQDMDGNLFNGFNSVRLNAELAAFGFQTSVFVSEKEIKELGVSVLPLERERFCTLEDGSHVWNLAQTSYKREFPDHFRAIEQAFHEPSMDDETLKGMRKLWKVDMGMDGNPNPGEGEMQKSMKTHLRDNFPSEQSGTLEEATKKSTMVYSIASLATVSKMRYNPSQPDTSERSMQFADIDTVRSFRKGASRYPAYEVMRSAGEVVAQMEDKHPVFQKREGIDVNAVIRHVNATIRIENERSKELSEAKAKDYTPHM